MDLRTIVNGAVLRRFINKPVSLFVMVEGILKEGKEIVGKTSDHQTVNVVLKKPLNLPLNGWVEVIGMPRDGSNIDCDEIISFDSNAEDEPFDIDAHNMLVTFMLNCRDIYKNEE